MILYAGEEFQSLQAVDAEFLEEIIFWREAAWGEFEVRCCEIQHFLRGLFQGGHDDS